MNFGTSARAATLVLACSAVAACAATGEGRAGPAAASLGAEVSTAERLADALADADRAFARGNGKRLADALRRVDALGGEPLDGSSAELARWRQTAAQNPPMRGRPLGPGFRSGELSPGSSEQLEQVFLSGKRASVALTAPDNSQLKLEIEDRHASTVCGREGNPNHCQWVPVFTDRYRIRVANPGNTAVKYFLVVD